MMRLLTKDVGKGPSNESGAQRRPTKKDKEKLTVASVARKIPRRSREKDLRSRMCWGVARTTFWTKAGRSNGNIMLARANNKMEYKRPCYA